MNWLTDFIRPRVRSLVEQKDIPDNLWQKCSSCEGMLFHRDLEKNLNVCYHCGHHLRITVKQRLAFLFDGGKYDRMELPDVPFDPLKFKDRKRYADRLKESRAKTGLKEAITVAKGTIKGQKVVTAAFNFSFMGGSMGAGVGEAIIMGAQEAVRTGSAFLVIPSSGGARMQEGMFSLIQMPRTIIAVEMVKEAGLPYIVLLTDPTTGGVSASFAMVGDIHIAEPGATIGFAGRRVIEETVREKLPEDFQTAEYLLNKGMVDMVVPREELSETVGRLISLLMDPNTDGKKTIDGGNDNASKGSKKSGNAKSGGSAKSGSGTRAQASKQVQAAKKAVKAYRKPQKTARQSVSEKRQKKA